MSIYALITATIAVTSQSREQIMAARILNYVYVGMELSVVPTFQSEIGKCINREEPRVPDATFAGIGYIGMARR